MFFVKNIKSKEVPLLSSLLFRIFVILLTEVQIPQMEVGIILMEVQTMEVMMMEVRMTEVMMMEVQMIRKITVMIL